MKILLLIKTIIENSEEFFFEMFFLILIQMNMMTCLASDLYTSLTHVQSLLEFDDLLGMALIQLTHHTPVQKSYLKSYRWVILDRNVIEFTQSGESISDNPLHIYALFKRMVLYWPDIKADLQADRVVKDMGAEMLERLYSAQQITIFPTLNDLRGCALAIARLQQVYRLDIEDMKQGMLQDHKSNVRLSVYDCLRIANDSFHLNHFSNSWLWYNAALNEAQDLDMQYFIIAHMDTVVDKHDSPWMNHENYFKDKLRDNRYPIPHDPTYYKLCRGEQISHSTAVGPDRRCYISHLDHPLLVLSPVKYEELSYDPEMFLVYDVISDREIQIVKQLAIQKLSRSTIQMGEDFEDVRVSQTAWLRNETHPVLQALAKRVEAITGLYLKENEQDLKNDDRGGEPFQVLSYGIGGHFLPHLDTFFKHKDESEWEFSLKGPGDRLATWMFYLSDVVAGGRTAFPNAGIAATPVKGAAVFWYNIYRNGYINTKTKHGGCPVLIGHKWVANKWIFENNNILRRPCGIHPDM